MGEPPNQKKFDNEFRLGFSRYLLVFKYLPGLDENLNLRSQRQS